jgi:hypothetical protein
MHPSEMQSFLAPPMPFHPEELHKHVTELERAFDRLPGEDLNARTAVAKATVAAVGAFMEGSIRNRATLRSAATLPPTEMGCENHERAVANVGIPAGRPLPGAWPAVGADVGG